MTGPLFRFSPRRSVRWAWLAPLLALLGCEQPGPEHVPVGAAGHEDGLSGLVLTTPLATRVQRLDAKRPLDAATEELVLEYAGGRLRLVLERHDALVSADYRTYEVNAAGEVRERAASERPPFCHYTGHVVLADGALGASASVTTCDARGGARFSALLRGERLVELRPVASDAARYELALLEPPAHIDDLDETPLPGAVGPRAPGLREQAQASAAATQITAELLELNDAARQQALGGVAATELNTLSIANNLSNVAAGSGLQPQLVLGLVGQLTFTSDPYSVTLSAGEVAASNLLDSFKVWSATAPLPEHDARQLFTGYELQTSTVGLAYLATMCNRATAAGIVQATFSTPVVATIALHELGHNLNMSHDESAGCAAGFIMSASTCGNCAQQPTTFSSCSQTSLTQFLAGNVTCLADPITPASGAPTCGNGVVEGGEQCDCGAASCGTRDGCCDGATCQLKAGATCSATQACCNAALCAPQVAGSSCRAGKSSCDLAETCDGISPTCPSDAYLPAGQSCSDASGGVCYHGGCLSRAAQCTAAEADYPQLAPLTPCGTGLTCAELQCRSGSSCYTLTAHNYATGTPCGSGKQCSSGQCVPSSQLNPTSSAQGVPALNGASRWLLPLSLLALGWSALRRRERRLS